MFYKRKEKNSHVDVLMLTSDINITLYYVDVILTSLMLTSDINISNVDV